MTVRPDPHGQPIRSLTRHAGPIHAHETAVRALRAPLILGHARLATASAHDDFEAIQPAMTSGGHALAHNGTIDNPGALWPDPVPSDSFAFAHAYAHARADGDSPWRALEILTGKIAARSWAIVVLDAAGRLYAHRRYHPLYRLAVRDNAYLSSWPFHPHAQLLPEDEAVAIT